MSENNKSKEMIIIDVPSYKGEDRRETEVVIGLCGCHLKHSQQIKDTEDDIVEVKSDLDKVACHARQDHNMMWDDIKSKVPMKLFYVFITVYSIFFIGGIVAVYSGMHKIDKNLTIEMGTISTNVKLLSLDLDHHKAMTEKIENNIDKMGKKVDKLTAEVKKNGNSHKKIKE